ncbi:MAG: hypothetical protein V4685_14570 [Bacteroidota bacterium]
MKKNKLQQLLQYALFIFFNAFALISTAQDSSATATSQSTTTTTTTSFVAHPWRYVAGAIIAVILLVALLRPRGKEVVRTTTVIKEPRN